MLFKALCPWLCFLLYYRPLMRHDLYTLDAHYRFCLVAERSFEYIITIIDGRLSRLGFEDLYTNTVCFTSLQLWSLEERLLSSCPGQGIDWDLLVCCFIYLFVCLFSPGALGFSLLHMSRAFPSQV